VATWYLWLGGARLMLSTNKGGFRERNLARDGRVALTVLGEDWYHHVSLRGRVAQMRADPDWADLDAVPVRNLIGASAAVAPRRVQPFRPEASSLRRGEGRMGRRVQTRPWIATRLAGSVLDSRSERRVGRGRGDQAARW
jgi:hypothetical protein